MKNIIGKCIILSIGFSVSSHASLTLRVTDVRGAPLKQAVVNEPFTIELTIKGTEHGTHAQRHMLTPAKAPVIKADPSFVVRHTGVAMQTINGSSTITYRYKATASKQGTFTVGPAESEHNNVLEFSNTFSLVVGDQQISEASSHVLPQRKAFMILSTNRERIVVGQDVTCTLKLYMVPGIHVHEVIQAPSPAWVIHNKKDSVTTTELLQGAEYQCTQWQWDMFATTSGEFTIPAYTADITNEDDIDTFLSFAFFGRARERSRIYSNNVKMVVDPLPEPKPADEVQGVGKFKDFRMLAEHTVLKQGEGVIVSLALDGQGNFEHIKQPPLHGLNPALRCYNSKNYVDYANQNKHSYATHYFEYVIQSLEPGTWEIPSQTFTYFDPEEYAYKTLYSEPLLITVTEQPYNSALSTSTMQKEVQVDSCKEIEKNAKRSHSSVTWEQVRTWHISFEWFVLLLFLPVLIVLNYYGACWGYKIWRRSVWARRHALKQLHTDLNVHNYPRVYRHFLTLWMDRLNKSEGELTEQVMYSSLAVLVNNDKKMLEQWHDFFAEMTAYAFSIRQPHSEEHALFKQRAEQWFIKLDELL